MFFVGTENVVATPGTEEGFFWEINELLINYKKEMLLELLHLALHFRFISVSLVNF